MQNYEFPKMLNYVGFYEFGHIFVERIYINQVTVGFYEFGHIFVERIYINQVTMWNC